jgi:hypothetical protein
MRLAERRSAFAPLLPPSPSISPGENPARSKSTCRSSSEIPTDDIRAIAYSVATATSGPPASKALAANKASRS